LAAQALGSGDPQRAAHTLIRALGLAAAIACALLALQIPLLWLGLALFEASAEAEGLTAAYFAWRIWGAPAELANYALIGWFAGQEMTRRLFQHQVLLASVNVGLNLWFVLGLGWGVEGVAIGTALANLAGLAYGGWLAFGRVRRILPVAWRPNWERVLDRGELVRLMSMNRDIFIRTLLLIGGFAWTARLGSLQGDAVLAANVVLLQFLMVSAYALDGFAIAAETLVGQAMGARDPGGLDRAAALTSIWSGGIAALCAAIFVLAGPAIVDLFTTAEEVRAIARHYLLWAALIPIAGFAAFQFDGIFVGATASREMRDAMVLTACVYFPGSWAMLQAFGNHGVWGALWIWLLLRAATLAAYYPRIRARALER
ncbi:MAG: MATE family efflux transporter, partial [Pseudomonadota bacterium]